LISQKPNLPTNPILVDLTYYPNSNIQNGGSIELYIIELCMNLNNNPYIEGIHNDKNIKFTFSEDNKKKIIQKCLVYAYGSYTAVYIINDETNNEFVLKLPVIFDVDKYIEDQNLGFIDNLPTFYYYGNLHYYKISKGKQIKAIKPIRYAICKRYPDIITLRKLDFNKRIIFFGNLINLLYKIEGLNKYINDLKPANMSYDVNFNPIIIDYDKTTIYNTTKDIPNSYAYCYENHKSKFTEKKIMLDGFSLFIFLLFIDKPSYPDSFNESIWHLHRSIDVKKCIVNIDNLRELQKEESVPDIFFKFIKEILIDSDNKGLYGDKEIMFNEIKEKFDKVILSLQYTNTNAVIL